MLAPYRSAPRDDRPRTRATRDRDLLAVGVVLFCASLARVAFAFARRETFGAIATLALFVVAAGVITSIRSLVRRARTGSSSRA